MGSGGNSRNFGPSDNFLVKHSARSVLHSLGGEADEYDEPNNTAEPRAASRPDQYIPAALMGAFSTGSHLESSLNGWAHMSLSTILRLAAEVIAVAVAAMSVSAFLRERDRARLDAALFLTMMALALLLLDFAAPIWRFIAGLIALYAVPYLLLRLVDRVLVPIPVLARRAAVASAAVAAAVNLGDLAFRLDPLTPTTEAPLLPPMLIVVTLGPFIAFELYAAVTLLRGALAATGPQQPRFAWLGLASGLLILPVLVQGVRNAIGAAVAPDDSLVRGYFVLAALAMIAYNVGFTPPRWLRAAWEQRELRGFLRELAARSPDAEVTAALEVLARGARHALGGTSAVVAQMDERTGTLAVAARDGVALDDRLLTYEGPIRQAWREQRPAIARVPEDLGPTATQAARAAGARSVLVVPITTGERLYGLLVVLLVTAPLFPGDALELLTLMTEQAALILSNARLLTEQRALATDLFQSNVALELERRVAQEALSRRELHDPVTDLPNRELLASRLDQVSGVALRLGASAVVLLVDLARFGDVNEAYGRRAGDAVLREVASRLAALTGDTDTLASLGGDQFVLVLAGADEARAREVAEHVHATLAVAFVVERQTLHLLAQIGIAVLPVHGRDTDTLLRHVDIALEKARRARLPFAVYEPSLGERATRATLDLADLRRAMDAGELELHYQPKVASATGRVVGVESLARWRHPSRGIVPPAEFLPLIERGGLERIFGRWTVARALAECHAWREAGYDVPVSVNAGMELAQDPELVDVITQALAAEGLPPAALVIEIVEDALMTERARVRTSLLALKELGVGVSLDDFGAGYSSLGYLRELPFHELKIDRSFTKGFLESASDAAICRAALELAHGLGLTAVAEGVEDAMTWAGLADLGYDVGQGYHFARPMPLVELVRWFENSPFGLASAETAAARTDQASRILDLAERSLEGSAETGRALGRDPYAVRIATDWALASRDRELALRFCSALRFFWADGGRTTEGSVFIERALELGGPDRQEVGPRPAGALAALAMLVAQGGDVARARTLFRAVVAMQRDHGDLKALASALSNLGFAASMADDLVASDAHLLEALALCGQIGDRRGEAAALNNLAMNALAHGDNANARRYEEGAIAIFRDLGDTRGIATSVDSLGAICLGDGDIAGALRCYRESLALARDSGFVAGMAHSLQGIVMALVASGEPHVVLRLIGAVSAFREHAQMLSAADEPRYARTLAELVATVPEDQRAAAIAQGRELSLEAASSLALELTGSPAV